MRYSQLVHNARLVRIGSTIVSICGWISLGVGVVLLLSGIVGVVHQQNDEVLGDTEIGRIYQTAQAWNVVQAAITLLIAGILLIAVAAFFKLIARTCEAIRDLVIAQTPNT